MAASHYGSGDRGIGALASERAIPHILIVDDDRDFCEELVRGLRLQDLEASCVTSAARALERIAADRQIGVVVTDITMPDMDGLELLQKLADRAHQRRLLTLVMTGAPSQDKAITALRASAVDFLRKPVDAYEIAGAVRRALHVQHARLPDTQAAVPERTRASISREQFIHALVRFRADRKDRLADLFKDPSWDMLLELLLAHERGRYLPITSVTMTMRVPGTTAIRHLEKLVETGLVERIDNPAGGRRKVLRLSEDALHDLRSLIDDLARRLSIDLHGSPNLNAIAVERALQSHDSRVL